MEINLRYGFQEGREMYPFVHSYCLLYLYDHFVCFMCAIVRLNHP